MIYTAAHAKADILMQIQFVVNLAIRPNTLLSVLFLCVTFSYCHARLWLPTSMAAHNAFCFLFIIYSICFVFLC